MRYTVTLTHIDRKNWNYAYGKIESKGTLQKHNTISDLKIILINNKCYSLTYINVYKNVDMNRMQIDEKNIFNYVKPPVALN